MKFPITNQLDIQLFDSPLESPTYTRPEYKAANLTTAVVVGNGTKAGKPTVDFIFEDEDGQKYIAMLTGSLIDTLRGAVIGTHARTDAMRTKN